MNKVLAQLSKLAANGLAGVFILFLGLWWILGNLGDIVLDGIFLTLLVGQSKLAQFATWLETKK